MSENIIIAIIQLFGGPLAVLIVGYLLKRKSDKTQEAIVATNAAVKSTKEAITNQHKEHLRDDLDAKFDTMNKGITNILLTQGEIVGTQNKILQRQNDQSGALQTLTARVDEHDKRFDQA